jgi:DNA-binding CsgD family transcriptional regulator
MPEAGPSRTSISLAQLSVGEREVCELLVSRCTTKEMARQLQLSINGVDWRVRTAREKLGARDRNDLARIYGTLKSDWGQSPVTPSPVAETDVPPIARSPETPSRSEFVFNDVASFTLPAPWEAARRTELAEVLDERFGRAWRVAAIPLGALGIAMVVAALIGIALMLGMLI